MPVTHETADTPPPGTGIPIACRLGEPALAARAAELRAGLFARATAVSEVPGGYAVRFPPGIDDDHGLSDVVAFERRCCPFLRFTVTWEPDEGPVTLTMTGPEGAAAFIAATFLPAP